MAFKVMADNNISISAKQDGALYNVALNNTSLIIKGLGDEFALSLDGLTLSVGTGEALIHGRHVTTTETNTITLPASSSGYVVLRLDLSQPIGQECRLYATPVLTEEEINWGGTIHDFPLCTFSSTLQSATFEDKRVIKNGTASTDGVTQSFDETEQGTPYKPQSPLKKGDDYFYPLTHISQVIKNDESRLSEDDFGIKKMFIDTSRLLSSGRYYGSVFDYTATEECYVCIITVGSVNSLGIDGVSLTSNVAHGGSVMIPIKKGTRIYSQTSGDSYVYVYGLK